MSKHSHKRVVIGKIVSKTQLSPEHFQIGFLCPYVANNIVPGQFIQVRLSKQLNDPLLCRPFAVYRIDDDIIYILFKVVGKGTRFLSEKAVGDELEITGPLGNGFPLIDDTETVLLIAGGMGIAALYLLAKKLTHRKVIAILGACSQDRLLGVDDLLSLGVDVFIATDDGSCGYKGMVSELFVEVVSKESLMLSSCRIYSCGPIPMLKAVAQIADEYKIPAYVSLEEKMACGIGACMGCACEVISSDGSTQYKMVCSDGPIFNAQEIVWK
jgi:dihydroorotate dehydrogenase electron transfer subunit